MLWKITTCLLTFILRAEAQRVSQQGADWYLRFRSEREEERVETVAYRVTTSVKHRYSITKVERDMFNPCNSSKEFVLSLVIPSPAVVTQISIGTAALQHMSENTTVKSEEDRSASQTRTKVDWKLLNLPLLLPPRENLTLTVTYEEVMIPVSPMHYRLQMFHDVGEIVRDSHFSLMVDITEERSLTNLTVRTMHPAIGDVTKETVTLPVEGNQQWGRVSLSLNTREQACYFGSRGVHGQLAVDWLLSTSTPQPLLLSSSNSSPSSPLPLTDSNLYPTIPESSYTVPKEYEDECRSTPISSSSSSLSSSLSSSASTTGFSSVPSPPVSLN